MNPFRHLRAGLWLLGLLIALSVRPALGQELQKADPAAAGFTSQGLQRVQTLLEDAVTRKQVAGAVGLIIKGGKVVYYEAVGKQDAEAGVPMSRDTLFRIASMTKPVTSVAIMMLVEEGKVGLDDPVSKYIPEFQASRVLAKDAKPEDADPATVPAEREVSIRDLLRHTSGLVYGFSAPPSLGMLYAKAGIVDGLTQTDLTAADNARRLARMPLAHQPGAAWTYGLNTDVLGRVVEVASGKSLDRFLHERIFEPLKMADTAFYITPEQRPKLSALYTVSPEKTVVRVGEQPVHAGPLTYSASVPYQGPRTYFSGGAGLVSSAGDYARFLLMLLNGGELDSARLLKPETIREMTSNQIGPIVMGFGDHGDRFGLGFGITTQAGHGPAAVGSYSWGGIYYTFFWVDPKNELVGILLTQVFPTDHLTLRADFQKRVYEAMAEPKAQNGENRPERLGRRLPARVHP
ncbi:MAG TPA: serine hydrolase domain-containing protein [Isosphaeraceae bacterium]|jgi:CubicO group peptidase (beta-lactamase class C family)|nr:serine hydrolase domain-containing protein [Isosphaeraceae bacterium]